jgi:hypothetical protein
MGFPGSNYDSVAEKEDMANHPNRQNGMNSAVENIKATMRKKRTGPGSLRDVGIGVVRLLRMLDFVWIESM